MTRTVWRMPSTVRSAAAVVVLALTVAACGADPLAEVGQNTTTTTSTTSSTTTTTTQPPPTVPVDPDPPRTFDPPGAEWTTGDLPDGVDPLVVADMVQRAVQTNRWGPVTAVVVAKDGELIAEAYREGHNSDSSFASGTAAAIVVNALVGALVTDQAVHLYEPWWVSAWAEDERFAINPNTLLRHVSGIEVGPAIDLAGLRAAAEVGSVADHVITQPYDDDTQHPWESFEFSPGNLAVLARMVEQNVTVNGALSLWSNNRLFEPLGITSARLEDDASGTWVGFEGVTMTARDYVRLGTLYALDGAWGDERLLAPDWVEYSGLVLEPSTEFGAGFWVDRFGAGSLSVEGNGQRLIIIPDEGLVVAVFSVFASDAVIEDFAQDLTAALRTN